MGFTHFYILRLNLKNCEIATQLNITVKSVEANMTRALKMLRSKLAEYLPLILVQLIMKNF